MSNTVPKDYWWHMFGEPEEHVIDKHNECVEMGYRSRLQEAYERAHEVRKFEIELYWKRALYFWGFEAAFMLAFGTLLANGADVPGQRYYLAVLACFAFFFTVFWRSALKGSKQWQQNWETHIDFLEPAMSGNLYKTVLHKEGKRDGFRSVSRVNEDINWLLILMWIVVGGAMLIMAPLNSSQTGTEENVSSFGCLGSYLVLMAAIGLGWLLSLRSKTKFENESYEIIPRSKPELADR